MGAAQQLSLFAEAPRPQLELVFSAPALKLAGLASSYRYLASADSMAWSFNARKDRRGPNNYDVAREWLEFSVRPVLERMP